jgi:hypothetical protein
MNKGMSLTVFRLRGCRKMKEIHIFSLLPPSVFSLQPNYYSTPSSCTSTLIRELSRRILRVTLSPTL